MLNVWFQHWYRLVQSVQGYTQNILAITEGNSPNSAVEGEQNSHTSPTSIQIEELGDPVVSICSIQGIIESNTSLREGKLKSFEVAHGYFKLLPLLLPKKFNNAQNQRLLQFYMEQLNLIESSALSQNSFQTQESESVQAKHVIVFEGLTGTGKSSIIGILLQQCPSIEIMRSPYTLSQFQTHRNNDDDADLDPFMTALPQVPPQHSIDYWEYHLYAFIAQLPLCFQILFQYLELYRIAYRIQISKNTVFLVENYYHAFLVQGLLLHPTATKSNSTEHTYTWPLDLPLPELVLYLTTSTDNRLERLQSVVHHQQQLPTAAAAATTSNIQAIYAQDNFAHELYTKIGGPGTVGIDSSSTTEQVYYTILEALDYYGVYSITRTPPLPMPRTSYPPSSTTSPSKDFPITSEDRHHITHTQRQYEGSSTIYDDDNLLGVNTNWLPAGSESQDDSSHPTNYRESVRYSVRLSEPRASREIISNRRISMGIYNMYSNFS